MDGALTIRKNTASIWCRVAVLGMLSTGCIRGAYAQTASPSLVVQPIVAPAQLFEQLSLPDTDQFARQRAAALKSLGIEAVDFESFRLTYEDLDDDGKAEALFTVDLDLANEKLVVLKRKGNQWYRLASPPGFSCWRKYDYFRLDTFAKIRSWGLGSGIGGGEPTKLLFVRGSGGGTGLYARNLTIYVLRGFVLKEIFGVTEERRECDFPDGSCNLHHVEVTTPYVPDQPLVLLATSYERRIPYGKQFFGDTWWIGSPVQQCKAYTWSAKRQAALENAGATATFCSHLAK